MARTRSYLAKSNRGKGAEVFMNNLGAGIQKARKARLKNEDREKRAREVENKRRIARQKKEAEQREKQLERERVRAQKEKQKIDEKTKMFVARFEAECEKSGLLFEKSIAVDIAEKCMKAGITVAKMREYHIAGKENEIQKNAIMIIAVELTEKYTEGMRPADLYLNSAEGKKLLNVLMKSEIKTTKQIKENKDFKSFAESVSAKESEAKFWHEQSSRIENHLQKIRKTRMLLPEHIPELMDFVRKQDQLTFDDLLSSAVYKKGIEAKKRVVSDVDKRFNQLISG